MQFKNIFRVLGIFLMMFSLSMLPPVAVALWYEDGNSTPFLSAFVITWIVGFLLWFSFRKFSRELKSRDGFLIVTLFWVLICLFGSLPFMLGQSPKDTFTDAVFESVSGFTTTGATVTVGIDALPHAIRYYRQQCQFIGGMGIIVLAVAILPMLGIGGMQLYRAETPGPVKDSKLTPRITETAKTLWYTYLTLIGLCALLYWAAGMTLFEAIGESFATISTGGFSLHDKSFAYYNNPVIEVIAIIFMMLGSINFGLHFFALRHNTLKHYWEDTEFRVFCWVIALGSLLCLFVLLIRGIYPSPFRDFTKIVFNVVSLTTTTGYSATTFSAWPMFLTYLVFFMAMIGGCGGSTTGGIKLMRVMLLYKQVMREMGRLVHPSAVIAMKFGGHTLPPHVLEAMWSFISAFVGISILLLLALVATGLDLNTAFGVLVGSLANAGQGLGTAAQNFSGLNVIAKWLLIIAMLIGRLEIFTILILFTGAFWRN